MRVLGNPVNGLDNSPMNWDFVRRGLERVISEKGWSHNLIAEKSGVPQPTISRFLSGETGSMQLDTLWSICGALGVSVAEIIGERPVELDDKARRVVKAMENLPDYKKEVVVSTAETLAKGRP